MKKEATKTIVVVVAVAISVAVEKITLFRLVARAEESIQFN